MLPTKAFESCVFVSHFKFVLKVDPSTCNFLTPWHFVVDLPAKSFKYSVHCAMADDPLVVEFTGGNTSQDLQKSGCWYGDECLISLLSCYALSSFRAAMTCWQHSIYLMTPHRPPAVLQSMWMLWAMLGLVMSVPRPMQVLQSLSQP